jgi:hypothetical protein
VGFRARAREGERERERESERESVREGETEKKVLSFLFAYVVRLSDNTINNLVLGRFCDFMRW